MKNKISNSGKISIVNKNLIKGYIGTYTTENSLGIYTFTFDTRVNEIIENTLFAKIPNPKYLCFAKADIQDTEEIIATVCDMPENSTYKSGVAIYNKQGKLLSQLAYENKTSCYITHKDTYLYTANYHEGTFTVLKIEKDYSLTFIHKTLIKEKAGTHQVIIWKDKILLPCLFLDKIYVLDRNYEFETTIDFPQKSVRHGVCTPDGKYLFVVGELDNKIYTVDLKEQKIVQNTYILENEKTNLKDSAAIRISKDGKNLYVSTRTLDVISVFDINYDKQIPQLKLIQNTHSFGEHPRDFEINDELIFIPNRLTNTLAIAKITNKKIGNLISEITVPEGVSIILQL